jgi:Flp pilus assembly protein TadG
MRGAPQTVLSRFRDDCRECEGNALIEFAMIGPLLIALLVGIVWLGALVNNYITLTDAVSQGARAFAESTNITTAPVSGDPCTYAKNMMFADAQSLNTASITYTITYTPAATGTGVTKTVPCSGFASSMIEGDTVTIQATYPALGVVTTQGASILTHLANWTLSAHTTQVVQ